MEKKILILLLIFPFFWGGCRNNENELKITEYVNPFIGTTAEGQCFPGAVKPFGGIQISPDYRYCPSEQPDRQLPQKKIASFSHTRLSGAACHDFQDIRLMPAVSIPTPHTRPIDYIRSAYATYSPENESAEPGYYTVGLDNGIKTEISVTDRCGIYYFQYPPSSPHILTVDLGTSNGDRTTETSLRKINNRTIEGYRKSDGFLKNHQVYFVIEFSQDCHIMVGNEKFIPLENGQKFMDQNGYAWIDFGQYTDKVLAKISISSANTEGAAANLEKELSHWSFDKIRRDAKQSWKKELIKTKAEGGNEKDLEIFYTALYHAYLTPQIFSDANGNYKGPDGEIHSVSKYTHYTVFPLEAAYRTVYPLFAITQKKKLSDIINSMLKHYDTYGQLPACEFADNETYYGGANPAIPVITMACLKGVKNFDAAKAYQAMIKTLETGRNAQEDYYKLGYVPDEAASDALALTLAYAYEDWCIAQVAKALGLENDYLTYLQSSRNYIHLFDSTHLRLRSKSSEGHWSPAKSDDYLSVLHDIPGLISLYGGTSVFSKELDRLFTRTTDTDSTCLGGYHHREVCRHHLPYLYNQTGEPEKTQYYTDLIRHHFYHNTPDGLCGNENFGQQSAWYIFSAMGFYPVNPAEGKYRLGSPAFKKVTLRIGPERRFIIKANKENENYIYVREVYLNGKRLDRDWITHEEIMNGGELEFILADQPIGQRFP